MSEEDQAARRALIGRTVGGKFLIDSFLGEGAMGAVFKARQLALDKVVAIKVMHPDTAKDELFVTRFKREAKAASRLDHPNSMRVIDFGEDDGLLYIAMEFVDGHDLFHVMKKDWPLSTQRVVEIMMQALAALAVAHDMGVIHRDLKPENIMVIEGKDDEGHYRDQVKVCDFGIAKIESRASGESVARLSTKGLVVGTPEYMSPEQGKGEPLDPRTDLYSMGVILFQLLTGRVPFEAESALGVVLKHVTELPPQPRTLNPDVDPRLEAVCMKAMQKKREDRYASAREMRAEFKALIESGTVSVPLSLGARIPALSDAMAHAATMATPHPALSIAPTPSKVTPPAIEALDDMPAAGVPKSPGLVAALVVMLGLGGLLAGGYFVVLRPMQPAAAAPDPLAVVAIADAAPAPLVPDAAPPPAAPSAAASTKPAPMRPLPVTPLAAAAASPPDASSPFDPAGARVTWRMVRTSNIRNGALSQLFDEVNLTGCYRASLKVFGKPLDGKGTLHLETADTGQITLASYDGASIGKDAITCIVQGMKSRQLLGASAAGTAEVELQFLLK